MKWFTDQESEENEVGGVTDRRVRMMKKGLHRYKREGNKEGIVHRRRRGIKR